VQKLATEVNMRDDFLTGTVRGAYDAGVQAQAPTATEKVQTPDLDALLTREQIATALTQAGFPVSAKTLATMVTRGGGPVYQRFGPRALYRWGPTLEWAKSRLSAPIRSTSELDMHRAEKNCVVLTA
jgi:hypothetical protein